MGAFSYKVNRTRLLSFALALVMLISCFPVLAFAEEAPWETESKYEDSAYRDSAESDEEDQIDEYDPWEDTEEDTDYWNYGAESHFFPDYTLEEYGDVMYASGTILSNGCSVVCLASMATFLTGHQYYPDELAR